MKQLLKIVKSAKIAWTVMLLTTVFAALCIYQVAQRSYNFGFDRPRYRAECILALRKIESRLDQFDVDKGRLPGSLQELSQWMQAEKTGQLLDDSDISANLKFQYQVIDQYRFTLSCQPKYLRVQLNEPILRYQLRERVVRFRALSNERDFAEQPEFTITRDREKTIIQSALGK